MGKQVEVGDLYKSHRSLVDDQGNIRPQGSLLRVTELSFQFSVLEVVAEPKCKILVTTREVKRKFSLIKGDVK